MKEGMVLESVAGDFNEKLLAALSVGIMTFSADGRCVAANSAVCQMIGRTQDQLLGRNLRDIGSWGKTDLLAAADRVLSGGTGERVEVHTNSSFGKEVWLDCALSRFISADKPYLLLTATDISGHKKAEQEFRTLFDSTMDGILIADVQSKKFVNANRSMCRMLGYDLEEMRSLGVPHIHPSADLPFVLEQFEKQVREETPLAENIPVKRKDGSVFYADVNAKPMKLGAEEYLVGIFRDVTLRNKLETELLQSHKLESVGRLASGIAHEINTPVQYVGDNTRFLKNAFWGIVNVLQEYEKLKEAARGKAVAPESLERVERAVSKADIGYLIDEIPSAIDQSLQGVDRISRIVQAMTEFSQAGVQELIPTDINHALETTIIVCRNEWKYVAAIRTDFDPELPLVSCLPADLNQAFLNIIVNAAQAIAQARQSRTSGITDTISVSTATKEGLVEVRIGDTGPGIAEDIRDRVMDPFFTTRDTGQGIGQGLAIARSTIVDKHAGELFFETREGEGTTFVIRLPIEGAQG